LDSKRIASGAILIPIVIALLVLGGWAYQILILVAMLGAATEFAQMFRKKGFPVSLLWISLLALAWPAEILLPESPGYFPIVTGVLLGMTLRELWETRRHPKQANPTSRWALTLAGGTYLGIGGAHLIGLRALPDGLWWVLTTFIIVWVSDSAAYFIGRRWGRHKMAPAISPGKSWEGYAAQVVSGPLIGVFLAWLWPTIFPAAAGPDLTLTLWYGLLVGGIISVLCPAGDFLISMMKREAGVKDTSNLIPGHGGILDRIDSILWAGMLAHLFAQIFIS
jgi:phosphatidate cytidylyltransferase